MAQTTARKTTNRATPSKPKSARVARPTSASQIDTSAQVSNPASDLIREANTTRGRVAGYSVGASGLVVNLDVGAISRICFSVGADEPHFRSAVSMAMVGLNNRVNPATTGSGAADQQWLWVLLENGTEDRTIRPAVKVAASWSNDADPFDFEGWHFKYEG